MQDESDWVTQMLSWRPAGIVLTGIDHDPNLRRLLRSVEMPTVEIWESTEDPIDMCVGINHHQAGFELAELMIELGYCQPAFMGFSLGLDPRSDRRFEGIKAAFNQLKPSSIVLHSTREEVNQFKAGYDGAVELLSQQDKPDVIFFANDHMAVGGLSAAAELGLNVPTDIGVVGFNALPITEVLRQPLTTVRTPRRHIGELAARKMISKIRGVEPQGTTTLPTRIEVGATTRNLDR